MKHTTEEMIFAALLRERISSLRLAKISRMSDEEVKTFDGQGANALIEEAMEELNGIAALVKQIRGRESLAATP